MSSEVIIEPQVEVEVIKIFPSKEKAAMRDYNKKYYASHRAERLKDDTVHCDACSKDIRKDNYKRHLKSKLHFLSSRINAIVE